MGRSKGEVNIGEGEQRVGEHEGHGVEHVELGQRGIWGGGHRRQNMIKFLPR